MTKENITSVLQENRLFAPPKEFQAKAKVKSMADYESIRTKARENPEGFWAEQARKYLSWDKDFTQTLEWNAPHAKWFADGKLNASVQCLDQNIKKGVGSSRVDLQACKLEYSIVSPK